MRKIIVADDQIITWKGFESYCKQVDLAVRVIHCQSLDNLYNVLRNERDLSLLILNIFVENANTLHHINTIKNHCPNLSILVVGFGKDIVFGVRAIREGADGYLNKRNNDTDILDAIRKTLNRERYFSSEIIASYTESYNVRNGNPFDKLSEREFCVMLYLINGMETNEIANLMSLQSTTISTYKSRIFEKLNLQRLNELKLMAEVYGIESWQKNGFNA